MEIYVVMGWDYDALDEVHGAYFSKSCAEEVISELRKSRPELHWAYEVAPLLDQPA